MEEEFKEYKQAQRYIHKEGLFRIKRVVRGKIDSTFKKGNYCSQGKSFKCLQEQSILAWEMAKCKWKW